MAAGSEDPGGRAFDHVLVLMFENQYRSYVLANPYLRRLARRGRQLGNAFGVMHPSQTNYIASIAGALCNVSSDEALAEPLQQRTIVDLIEEAPGDLRWRAYMESYVSAATPWKARGFRPRDAPPYYVKHNPFASFASIVGNERRWRCIDNEAALFADLLNGDFPEYAWFTPNMWSDGHWITGTRKESTPRAPQLVDQQAAWLEGFFGRLRFPGPQSLLPPRTLVVVTFDESDFEGHYLQDQASPYDGPNQIYTVLLGDVVEPGFEEEGYNHYSVLRTIEKNFGLGHLGRNDAASNWFQFLWRRHFEWSEVEPTPVGQGACSDGPIAAAQHAGAVFVATVGDDGVLRVSESALASTHWSEPRPLGVDGSRGIAAASTLSGLVVVAIGRDGVLRCLGYDLQQGWTPARTVCEGPVDACALIDFDTGSRLMLAARRSTGEVLSWVGTDAGSWGPPVPVAAAGAAGAITLGCLGASLFLIARTASATMNAVSYNCADYNTVQVAPNPYGGAWDDTTVDAWSPSAFPVAHFSSRPDADLQRQPLAAPYRTTGPMAAATLDGVVHLVHPGPGNPQLLTETFSLSGVMTPAKPVSYKDFASKTSSNGFGTLAEAGWSHQSALVGSSCSAGGAIAMARAGDELLLFHRSAAGQPVGLRRGRYLTKKMLRPG